MGDLVVVGAVLLVLFGWAAILLVMLRAARAQRVRVKRTNFGGRYSDFGFLVGVLRASRRQEKRTVNQNVPGADGRRSDGP